MKNFLVLIFLAAVFGIGHVKAQAPDVVFLLETRDYSTNNRISGAYVNVYSDGKPLAQVLTDSLGKVCFNLKPGLKYKVVVGGTGKVERFLYVDLENVKTQNMQLSGRCIVNLFDAKPETDYSFVFENPITTFYFEPSTAELQYEAQPAMKMAREIDRILNDRE